MFACAVLHEPLKRTSSHSDPDHRIHVAILKALQKNKAFFLTIRTIERQLASQIATAIALVALCTVLESALQSDQAEIPKQIIGDGGLWTILNAMNQYTALETIQEPGVGCIFHLIPLIGRAPRVWSQRNAQSSSSYISFMP